MKMFRILVLFLFFLQSACDSLIEDELFSSSSTLPITSGLVAHFSASDISGLNDGDTVSSWTDLSGNGNDLTQATTSRQPTYRDADNGSNSLPAVQFSFNSAITSLSIPSVTVTERTAFIAFEVLGAPPNTVSAIFLHLDSVASNNYALAADSNFTLLAQPTQASGSAFSNGRRIASIIIAGTTAELYLNGVQDVSFSSTAAATTGELFLGGDSTESFNGLISEVAIFDRALSSAERESVEAYLNGRYSAF